MFFHSSKKISSVIILSLFLSCFIHSCTSLTVELEEGNSEDEPPISKVENKEKSNQINYGKVCLSNSTFSETSPSSKNETWIFWFYIVISCFLVLFGGLMSGLTIGLMSLDLLNLRILQNVGDPSERIYASKVYPVVEKHHLLLVTLLLANAIAMEALPIFLDRLTNPVVAIIISVSLVLLFGEVIPQALCTRWGLVIGAHSAWLVKILILITFPISWPVSKLLDFILGKGESILFRRQELKELVNIHAESNKGPLSFDETTIIKGALDMKNKKVTSCMTPLESVFMLPIEQKINKEILKMIYETGHSRIPIFKQSRQNIVGLLITKRLLLYDSQFETPLTLFDLPPLPSVPSNMELYDMLNEFQTGRSHMVGICEEKSKEILGIVTLEDVIEELIQEEIIDETDVYVDVSKRVRVSRMLKQLSTPNLQRRTNSVPIEIRIDKGEETALIPKEKKPELAGNINIKNLRN